MSEISGIIVVCLAGLTIGSMAWPMKVCKRIDFEHQWLVAMIAGLVVLPWTITLIGCPQAFTALGEVDPAILLKANLFSLAWGVANVLMGVSITRIGSGLTFAILTGIGATLGVLVPMVFKGTGLFAGAPGLSSPSGLVILLGAAVMIGGVALTAMAGAGRQKDNPAEGSFAWGIALVVLAGVLSAGISFTFVFSQGPIVEAMRAHGASVMVANAGVWSVALIGGALVNILYPLFLLTKNNSWGKFSTGGWQLPVAALIGIQFFCGVLIMGRGMLLLGALGASVGFGIAQGMQIVGGQIVGFASGEWRGAPTSARKIMLLALLVLLVASAIMAIGNFLFTAKA